MLLGKAFAICDIVDLGYTPARRTGVQLFVRIADIRTGGALGDGGPFRRPAPLVERE